MRSTRVRSTILFAGAALSLLAACASLGSEQDQSMAGVLRREMQGYQEWAQFAGFPGIQESKSRAHGKFVATYINSIAAQDPAGVPFGSILVKENFSANDRATLESTTVMQRIEGYDPDNHDWFWARFTAGGELTHSGQVAMCADCHFDAGDDDFVFLND